MNTIDPAVLKQIEYLLEIITFFKGVFVVEGATLVAAIIGYIRLIIVFNRRGDAATNFKTWTEDKLKLKDLEIGSLHRENEKLEVQIKDNRDHIDKKHEDYGKMLEANNTKLIELMEGKFTNMFLKWKDELKN